MRIDTAAEPATRTQGRLSTARLMGYLLLAVLLMALDQRGEFVPRIRAAAEHLVSPVYQVAEAPAEALRGITTYSRSFDTVLEQNEQLREEVLNKEGDLQRLAALEEENERLRDLLQATEGRDFSYRFTELVQVSLDPYSHQVLIDRGAGDGVVIGQAVIDGQGVMGQVESTTGSQARVRLISDPEHAIPVQILRTGQRTVALGTGETNRLNLPTLPAQSDVREGDMLVTSGLGERFPPGFPVAEVFAVERETGGPFMNVDARPLAALDRGLEVLLVVPEPAPLPAPARSDTATGETGTDESGSVTDAGTVPADEPPQAEEDAGQIPDEALSNESEGEGGV